MDGVESFETFLARVRAATPEHYEEALRVGARRAGIGPDRAKAEFERMKAYVLDNYKDIHPVCSYLDPAGNPVDCIPFKEQPAYRRAAESGHGAVPTPPRSRSVDDTLGRPSTSQNTSQQTESVGTTDSCPPCPPNTVAYPRITLERLIASGTLDNHFRK